MEEIEPVEVHELNVAPGDRHPRVSLRFAEVDGRAMLVSIEIGARYNVEQGGVDFEGREPLPITTSVLRSIPLGRLAEQALWALVADYEALAGGKVRLPGIQLTDQDRHFYEERAGAAEAGLEKRRPGRPRLYDDEHFANVARVYREHSGGRAPTKAVAAEFKVSKATAAKWVSRAREMRLIEPTAGTRAE